MLGSSFFPTNFGVAWLVTPFLSGKILIDSILFISLRDFSE